MKHGKVFRATANLVTMTLAGLLAVFIGGDIARAADTEPPKIVNPMITLPDNWRFTRGNVIISAEVTDSSGIHSVKAIVTRTSDRKVFPDMPMTLTSGTKYSGVFACPGNPNADGQAMEYSVIIVAKDTSGNEGKASAGSFEVPAATEPPPPGLKPYIESLTPAAGTLGKEINVTINGMNFEDGLTVKLVKAGQTDVNATNVVVIDPSKVTCTFNLAGKATGLWNVVVTNPDGEFGTKENGFTINYPPPAVYIVTPDSGLNNGVVDLGVSGKDFRPGATVKLTRTGQEDIRASNVTVTSNWYLTCSVDLTNKVAGQWHVVVTNDDGLSGSLTNGFTVRNAPPTVTGISPNSGINTGKTGILNITGTGFREGARVKLTRDGQSDIEGADVVVVDSTKITCTFDLSGKAAGVWNVVVTNMDNQSGMLPNGFTILNPRPTITSITPNSGPANGLVNITIVGTGFQDRATVKLVRTGNSDITATNVIVVDSTKIICTFDLTGKAVGTWNVVVTNPDGQSATLVDGFTIRYPAPTITGITPNSGLNNGVVNITDLTGTNFLNGATVKLTKSGNSDIVGTNVVVTDSTKITSTLDLNGRATGQWNVVVTNPDGQSGTLENGFTINAAPNVIHDLALTDFSASPSTVSRGNTVTFSFAVKNNGNVTESNVTFRLLYGNQVVGNPQSVGALAAGASKSGTVKVRVPRRQNPGVYLITGEVVPVAGETKTDNNRQTVKVTVR